MFGIGLVEILILAALGLFVAFAAVAAFVLLKRRND
jgi:biopolymer transport protein ExbB/TolQ